jgi:hypothetical protein
MPAIDAWLDNRIPRAKVDLVGEYHRPFAFGGFRKGTVRISSAARNIQPAPRPDPPAHRSVQPQQNAGHRYALRKKQAGKQGRIEISQDTATANAVIDALKEMKLIRQQQCCPAMGSIMQGLFRPTAFFKRGTRQCPWRRQYPATMAA